MHIKSACFMLIFVCVNTHFRLSWILIREALFIFISLRKPLLKSTNKIRIQCAWGNRVPRTSLNLVDVEKTCFMTCLLDVNMWQCDIAHSFTKPKPNIQRQWIIARDKKVYLMCLLFFFPLQRGWFYITLNMQGVGLERVLWTCCSNEMQVFLGGIYKHVKFCMI